MYICLLQSLMLPSSEFLKFLCPVSATWIPWTLASIPNFYHVLHLNKNLAQVLVFSNLVAWTQLIDGQYLSSAESFWKQVNCTHLPTEHTVHVCRLRRAKKTLVKRLQEKHQAKRKRDINTIFFSVFFFLWKRGWIK